ncbi:hypothetical protein BC834DRAFT_893828 [Gloeopeniophorella convolvens]|nr:hypothetical protein BC834DRAFT_893828 [Gloeopeniophorella convolvens]
MTTPFRSITSIEDPNTCWVGAPLLTPIYVDRTVRDHLRSRVALLRGAPGPTNGAGSAAVQAHPL